MQMKMFPQTTCLWAAGRTDLSTTGLKAAAACMKGIGGYGDIDDGVLLHDHHDGGHN